jgi:hypothetical protein
MTDFAVALPVGAMTILPDGKPKSTTGATALPPPPALPNVPVTPPPTNLGPPQIGPLLNDIFSQWVNAPSSALALYQLPAYVDVTSNALNNRDQMLQGDRTYYQFCPYSAFIKSPCPQIKTTIPLGFENTFYSQGCEVFVYLSGFGTPAPVRVADVFGGGFASGLATRLALGMLFDQWNVHGAPLSASSLNITGPINNIDIPQAFLNRGNYDGQNEASWMASIGKLLVRFNVQALGLLSGWHAGGDLDALNQDAVRRSVWGLIRSRYSVEDIGAMAGFTLNYLVGFAKASFIRQNAAQIDLGDTFTLFQKVSAAPGVVDAKLTLSRFYDTLVAGFYSISSNSKLHAQDRAKLLGSYYGFLRGVFTGITQAADQTYIQLFSLAYGLGYNDGYREGYDKGYADGWRDGYAVGYSTAWSDANKIIDSLRSQLGSNAGSSIDDWIKAGQEVASIAEVVIGVIAMVA